MLRPMPIEPVPPETARVARAAFPKGHGTCASPMSWTRSSRMTPFGALSHARATGPGLPGGWRW